MPKSPVTSVRFSADLQERIEQLRARTGISQGEQIRRLLRAGIAATHTTTTGTTDATGDA